MIDAEIDNLAKLGVKFECNTLVGRLFTIEQMIDEMGFDAVFIGTGAGYPTMLGIPGDSLNGVLSANELLTRCNLMRAKDFPNFDTPLPLGPHVAVIGAGNTAMDAMRVCLRLGAEKVHCIYRRSKTEARRAPRKCITPRRKASSSTGSPTRSRSSTTARATCAACAASAWSWASPTTPAGGGRCRSPGSEFEFETDLVVFAIGTNANPIIGQTSKLKLNKWGYIEADADLATSIAGVYRRRRHRHRRGDRDRGDGRRAQGRAQHEGLSRPARRRRAVRRRRRGQRRQAVRHRRPRAQFRARPRPA